MQSLEASASSRYPVPTARHRVEDVVSRSRFITTAGRSATVAAARAFIDEIKGEFPDATHNCWAYAAGPPGDTAIVGMSDDGEPHGTAGRPMLNVLLHGRVGEIVVVVTRYFGGVKLGRGGLVRAYGGGVGHVLEGLPMAMKVERVGVEISTGYESVESLKRIITEQDGVLRSEDYGSEVTFHVAVPRDAVDAFEAAVAGATNGRAGVRVRGHQHEGDS